MGKKEKLRPLFNISDAEMYQESKTKRGFFLEDKADFIAFDADFADPFADTWEDEIEAAEAIDSDEVLDDQSLQLTNAVEEEMVKCRDKFQDTKYFIEKAFPDNLGLWQELGYDNYEEARRVQLKMVQFMKNFHLKSEKYKVKLIAAGYTQAKIDEIETLRKALDDANQAQEGFIGNLPVLNQARYKQNNKVWGIMVRVSTAGKRIYKNDFGKYQRYLLPPGEESPEALSIVGLVNDQANGNTLQGTSLQLLPPDITVESDAGGRYRFGGLPDGNYTLHVTLDNYVPQDIPVTITGGNAVEVNVHLVHV